MYHKHERISLLVWLFIIVFSVTLFSLTPNSSAFALLQSRFVRLSDSGTGATSHYLVGFTPTNTTTPVGSILIQFCSNDPLIGDTCPFPTGMNISAAVLSNQTGNTGFSIASSPPGSIILTRNPANPTSVPSTYDLTGIVNPSSPGQYYMRLQTFSSIDATGPNIEQGGIAIAITPALTVQAVVPPYLAFCTAVTIPNLNCSNASGDLIDFGNFSTHQTSSATTQFITATNAQNGYSVTVTGPTMTSGNNVIPNNSSPTTSRTNNNQFGINLTSNILPSIGGSVIGPGVGQPSANYNQSNNFIYNDGDIVAGASTASDYNKFTVSYIVNINSSQPEGVYATTISYICLANF
jgi:hypothetical protein